MLERREREKSLLGEQPSQHGEQVSSQSQRQQRGHMYPMAQMDRLFDEIFKRPFFSLWSHRLGEEESEQQLFVPIDIFEDGESVVVKAELPGMKKEDINLELTPDTITISGEKRTEQRVSQENFSRLECSYGAFTRTCQLPAQCLTDKARAVFKDGILEVRLPKSQETRQRSRQINIE